MRGASALIGADSHGLASGPGEHPSGTPERQLLTVLFVDVVGSTERLVEVGDRRWREMLRRHHEASSRSVREYGGRVVNVTGDGMLSVFASPASALRCAPRLLAAAQELELDLRAGIHTGECEVWEGEVAGVTVHTGARIAALADPGEILVSSTLRALVAGSDLRFVERGTYWLKGVPGEWRVLAMADPAAPALEEPTPADATAPSEIALPSRLALFAGQPFVGRERERRQLRSAIASVRGGGQATVFLAGEPGIGKTRLTAAVCEEARASGCDVLYGRCDEDLGLPMQPLVEALEHLVEIAPSSLLRRHVAERGGELALLVPSLERRVPALPVPRAGQEEENRRVLVNAIAGLLAAAAVGRGLVLVLDDLHWADQTTILVLRHMILSHVLAGVAVVGTYRDTDIADEHPLAAMLADVSSEPGVSRVALRGLDQADVALLLEGLGAGAPGEGREALARVVREETDGNPLFVVELLRALDDGGALHRPAEDWIASRSIFTAALPGTVREAILRRVRRLDPGVLAALSTASVIGREFDFELLRTVCGVDENELLDMVEAAIGAHLLQEVPAREVRFTFTHALIEYTLYGELSLARRQRLHQRVAEGIEQRPDAEIEHRPGELAYHWAESSSVGGPKALHFAEAAGEQALAQLAFAEAVGWFRRALEILKGQPAPSHLRARELHRAELLLRLGGAQRRAGDPECRATLLAAVDLARRLGETEMLVAAALAKTRGVASEMGRVDHEQVRALESALQAVGEGDSRERAELLSMLAIETLFDGDHVQRWARSDEALAIARRVGDHNSLMRVLTERAWAINAPDTLTERLANLDEAVGVHGQEHHLMRVLAIRARADARLEAGDVGGMEADVVRCELEAAALLEPLASWWAMCPRLELTMLRGRLSECERLTQEFLQLGMRAGQPDALTFFAAALVGLRRQQGRMGEVRVVYEQAVAENPTMPAWSGGLALAYAAEGDRERALVLLRAAAADRFAHMPRDWVWLVGICQWAESAALLEEREACECLYGLLLPWRERVITTGTAAWGTVVHHLCLLAVSLGLDRERDEHLREAASLHARLGAPVWLAETHVMRARMMFEREGRQAAARCGRDLRSALLAARGAGAAGVERKALDLMTRLGVDADELPESAAP
jgi:class 3 adenylate cyclase